MKDYYLKIARENGHTMIRVSPDRYECLDCMAEISSDESGCNNWQAKGINATCEKVYIKLTGKGLGGKQKVPAR